MRMEQSTEVLLTELRLLGIKEGLGRRMKEAQSAGLGHEELISMLLQDELDFRRNARIQRLLRAASFRQPASLEAVDWNSSRGLDRKQISDLSGCRFIRENQNILILGPTGVGKTFLATAIGNSACRSGHSALFFRMNSLIEQTILARAKGTYLNLLRRLGAAELLVLDDFGIKPLQPQHYQDLYDILDERSDKHSTIITSQVPPENWSEVIQDPVSCEAITDRFLSGAVRIQMKGESQRKTKRPKSAEKLDMN